MQILAERYKFEVDLIHKFKFSKYFLLGKDLKIGGWKNKEW